MVKNVEAQIDELFQLPLDQFTAARNALAKAAGKNGAEIKQLSKPPLAAWAVNQLYWSQPDAYEALVKAAEQMRRTHKAVIEGGRGDLREAGREHEHALDVALKATVAVMRDAAQPINDTTRHAILNTLRALPSDEAAGRLTRALTPGGFEMLSGFKPAKGPVKSTRESKTTSAGPRDGGGTRGKASPDNRAEQSAARQKAEREGAERAVRAAEHEAKRAEFESARTARDAARAERRLEEAREALQQAREELEIAEKEAASAIRAREAAERKSREAESAVDTARGKARRS